MLLYGSGELLSCVLYVMSRVAVLCSVIVLLKVIGGCKLDMCLSALKRMVEHL